MVLVMARVRQDGKFERERERERERAREGERKPRERRERDIRLRVLLYMNPPVRQEREARERQQVTSLTFSELSYAEGGGGMRGWRGGGGGYFILLKQFLYYINLRKQL
jgi:hypothetical protein